MKIVYIKKYRSQGLQHELTYGKVYETVDGVGIPSIDNFNYWIINDKGNKVFYSRNNFITLEESRNIKLKELEINE